MKLTPKQYAEALYDTISTTSPKHQEIVLENFLKVLTQNNDLKIFEQIAEEFHKLELKAKGHTLAHVTSAHLLSSDAEKLIIHKLNDLIKGKVELKKKVDENLIGGVVIQMEDTVIDASTKKSLEDLKSSLENN